MRNVSDSKWAKIWLRLNANLLPLHYWRSADVSSTVRSFSVMSVYAEKSVKNTFFTKVGRLKRRKTWWSTRCWHAVSTQLLHCFLFERIWQSQSFAEIWHLAETACTETTWNRHYFRCSYMWAAHFPCKKLHITWPFSRQKLHDLEEGTGDEQMIILNSYWHVWLCFSLYLC